MVNRKKVKVVGASCVYNEEYIIEYWAKNLSELVDEIVIVDDGSQDRTVEILKKFPKVTEIYVQPPMQQTGYAPREHINRNIMQKLATKRGADWIIYLDADEIFSFNMKEIVRDLVESVPDDVVQFTFTKVWLWRCEHLYRVDRPEKFLKPAEWRFYRNIPGLRWVSEAEASSPWRFIAKRLLGMIGSPRIFSGAAVLKGLNGRTVFLDNVVLLHYACVNMEKEIKKRMKYAVGRRFLYKSKSLDQICDEIYSIIDERGLTLNPVNPDWFPPEKREKIEKLISERFFPQLCFTPDYLETPKIHWT